MYSELDNLLGQYWDLAYAEGKDGRVHDTVEGAAQKTLAAIHAEVEGLIKENIGEISDI